MRHPRFASFAFALGLLIAGLGAAAQATAQTGLLWRVQHPEGAVSHLFGTIHSEDSRVLKLPSEVRDAMESARSLTLEAVLDQSAMLEMSRAMFLPQDYSLRNLLGPDLFGEVETLLRDYGIPAHLVDSMKPWAIVLTLSSPRAERGTFLDMELYKQARERGKPVHGLESIEEQIAYFDDMPLDDQIRLLEDSVEHYDRLSEMHEALIGAWLERDLGRLEQLNDFYLSQSEPEVSELFNRRFIVDRNRLMVERMEAQLEQGEAFIAVGVLHLPGEKGLLRLLEERGYEVDAVY